MSTREEEEPTGGQRSLVALRWSGNASTGFLELLDQRKLPQEEQWLDLHTAPAVAEAIQQMVVRGAPAIGCAAAYGLVLAAQEAGAQVQADDLREAALVLAASRPTAVNLQWALERMLARVAAGGGSASLDALFDEAESIVREDVAANRRIGDLGAALLPEGDGAILTICNTGSLATAGYGTALGVIRSGWHQGRFKEVLACETRPYLQGARLTLWELLHDGIPAALITDSAAGHMMQRKAVKAVVVGADRIAANGDTANKIGTYTLAVLARAHQIPFFVAAPWSTLDFSIRSGDQIPIEERSSDEVVRMAGHSIAPEGARALHPAFDVTPASMITAIVTDHGVAQGNLEEALAALRTPSGSQG